MRASSPARWPWSRVSSWSAAVGMRAPSAIFSASSRAVMRSSPMPVHDHPLGAGQRSRRRPARDAGAQHLLGPRPVDPLEAQLAREHGADRDRRRVGHGVAPRVVVHGRDDHMLCRAGRRASGPVRDHRGRRASRRGRLQGEGRRPRAAVVRDADADAAGLRPLGGVERLARDRARRPLGAQRVVEQLRDRHRAVLRRPAAHDGDRPAVPDCCRDLRDAFGRRVEQPAHGGRLRGDHLLRHPGRPRAQLGVLVGVPVSQGDRARRGRLRRSARDARARPRAAARPRGSRAAAGR